LVDNGLVPGRARWTVIPPGKGGINDHGQGSIGRVIAPIIGQIGLRIAQAVAKKGISPAHITANRFGVGVEYNLVGVEAVPLLWCVGAMDAIAVELTREHLWQVSVPDVIRLGWQRDAVRLLVSVSRVKEAQLHLRSVLREERKIHPFTI